MKSSSIIGHRGACGHAPENTLASIRKVAELGVGCVEFDTMLSADDGDELGMGEIPLTPH